VDASPRALAQWLPYLAAALVALSIAALTPAFTGSDMDFHTCMGALVHVPEIAILLGLSIAVPGMTWAGAARIPCQRLLYGIALALGATALGRLVDVDIFTDTPRVWLFLEALGALLLAVGGPGIWGSAIAREVDPVSPRASRGGRMAAAVTFVGFLAFFIAEGAALLSQGPSAILDQTSLATVLPSLVRLVGRGCLLWATFDSWRPCADEPSARERARRIKILMVPWVFAALVSSILSAFFWRSESLGYGHPNNVPMLIWHGCVQFILSILGAILLALALETPTRSYAPRKRGPLFPEPPPPADQSPIDVP
jgi:hypothetical protein